MAPRSRTSATTMRSASPASPMPPTAPIAGSYGYDALDRLNAATSSSISRGWTYDANGNRLTQTGSRPRAQLHDSAWQQQLGEHLTGSLPRTYAYDAAGNTLALCRRHVHLQQPRAHGEREQWRQHGELPLQRARSAHPANRRRARRTLYAYDEAGHLVGEYDGSGALDPGDRVVGRHPHRDAPAEWIGGGVNLFYVHTDQLNTPRLSPTRRTTCAGGGKRSVRHERCRRESVEPRGVQVQLAVPRAAVRWRSSGCTTTTSGTTIQPLDVTWSPTRLA